MPAGAPSGDSFGRMLEAVASARLVPVVSLASVEQALPLADALIAGGIAAVEITLRTASGVGAIAALAGYSDRLTVGAGTVVSPEQLDEVADAGAEFVISPGIDEAVVRRSLARGILPIPGVATASEVQLAQRLGLGAVKAFPASLLGGPGFVRAMRGPFPEMRFLPSGGVSLANAAEYLATPGVLAVSGSWMVPDDAVASSDWERIAALGAAAMAALGADPLG
ncbi:bifunctional 4-hydroxy-2-oxoglutarate aldolase/2-dehydro-3-deoxy-phosphogluconate aldolase [Nonlabens tegetincola]